MYKLTKKVTNDENEEYEITIKCRTMYKAEEYEDINESLPNEKWSGKVVNKTNINSGGEEKDLIKTWDQVCEYVHTIITDMSIEDIKEKMNKKQVGEYILTDNKEQKWLVTVKYGEYINDTEGNAYIVEVKKTDDNAEVSDEYMTLDEAVKKICEKSDFDEEKVREALKNVEKGTHSIVLTDNNGEDWTIKSTRSRR